MGFDDYKVVWRRNQPEGWVAEIPAIPGCHALMPTPEEALAELAAVFRLISEEHRTRDQPLPADTTSRNFVQPLRRRRGSERTLLSRAR